jgi:integrase/recombinase XerC
MSSEFRRRRAGGAVEGANTSSSGQSPPTILVIGGAQVSASQKRAISAVSEYRAHLLATERNPRTRKQYGRQADAFVAWTVREKRRKALSDPSAFSMAVADYVTAMKHERKWAGATVNAAVSALSHFSRFRGLGDLDGLREDVPTRAPRALGADDLAAVQRAAKEMGTRAAAIFALLAYCGLRVSEASALERTDLVGDQVIVRAGKGGYWRTVPVSSGARQLLAAWLAERGIGPGALFPGRERGLSAYQMGTLVREMGDRAGVRVSPHVLRHTFATRLIRNGIDNVIVAELLGHRQLETIRVYTAPTEDDVAQAVEFAVVGPRGDVAETAA